MQKKEILGIVFASLNFRWLLDCLSGKFLNAMSKKSAFKVIFELKATTYFRVTMAFLLQKVNKRYIQTNRFKPYDLGVSGV